MSITREALDERTSIEDNKQFGRLSEKTQVLVPQVGLEEVGSTRMSHSYVTGTSTLMVGDDVAEKNNMRLSDVDHQLSLENTGRGHDIGHPPFGHDGQRMIDQECKERGIPEGFDDNNNNLVVVEKNEIALRDYTKVSLIKYPNKLYPYQKELYIPTLEECIRLDKEHFSQFGIDLTNQKRTIACEIMDEADRNSYTCCDMSDFLCMGNQLEPQEILKLAEQFHGVQVGRMLDVAMSGYKSDIKKFFSDLKNDFNRNHRLTSNGLEIENMELYYLREFINKLTMRFYIKPLRNMPFHQENMHKLKVFIERVFDHDFLPSKYYREQIASAESELDVLRAKRDMIGEMSDWYVIMQYDRFELLSEDELRAEVEGSNRSGQKSTTEEFSL